MGLKFRVFTTAQLNSLNISFQATPPTYILPTNVNMRHWNVQGPTPEDLVEKYDISA